MNQLQKIISNKCKEITKEIDDLHMFRMTQKRHHGDLYKNSLMSALVNLRIARLIFWKECLKFTFRLK